MNEFEMFRWRDHSLRTFAINPFVRICQKEKIAQCEQALTRLLEINATISPPKKKKKIKTIF